MPPRDPFGIVGTTLDRRYAVERLVAEGGFGFVYRAHAVQLGVPVALKLLRGEIASLPGAHGGEDARARFEQEARLLVRLRHPAIVEVKDAAHLDDGTPYLVLAWIDGETLAERLQRTGAMEMEAMLALLWPVASAIEYAHKQGVVHRDLKPGNVMVGSAPGEGYGEDDGANGVKVLDFGVARWAHVQGVRTTSVSSTGLSIGYAAPEQYGKEFGAVDGRVDQFALAGIVYSTLTGDAPFGGETVTEVMFATCYRAERPSVRARRPELAAELDAVLRRALAIRPGDRFKTLHAFWSALVEAAGVSAAASTGRSGTDVEPATLPTATLPDARHARDMRDMRETPRVPLAFAPTERGVTGANTGGLPNGVLHAAHGTVRQGEAPPPTRTPPRLDARHEAPRPSVALSSSAASAAASPGARLATRVLVVLAVAGIVGGGLYAAQPWLFPSSSAGGGPDVVVASTPHPSAKASGTPSASADPAGCGRIAEGEACIVGARFLRGPDDCGASDPAHRAACPAQTVFVPSFLLDTREVTASRYRACVERGRCRENTAVGAGDLPARNVEWLDARSFCASEGKRLPTDDEWELAAAGTASRAFPWGNDSPTAARAVFSRGDSADGSNGGDAATTGGGEPAPVGSLPAGATPDGILDLAGNVAEWTSTAAPAGAPTTIDVDVAPIGSSQATDAPTPRTPTEPGAPVLPVQPVVKGGRRWVRGGSYRSTWDALRTWTRDAVPETTRAPTIGFRCARSAKK